MTSYRDNGPRMISAKYKGKCKRCGAQISKGESVLYYPREKAVLCKGDSCSGQAIRDIRAAEYDEMVYASQ